MAVRWLRCASSVLKVGPYIVPLSEQFSQWNQSTDSTHGSWKSVTQRGSN